MLTRLSRLSNDSGNGRAAAATWHVQARPLGGGQNSPFCPPFPTVVPGAGAFEVAAAHHLRTVTIKKVEGRAKLGVEAFAEVSAGGMFWRRAVGIAMGSKDGSTSWCSWGGLACAAQAVHVCCRIP